VVGLDPDPKALSRAKHKTERAALAVRFDQGFADELPYSDSLFDACSPRSCSTTSRWKLKEGCCMRSDASLSLMASFTCSISKDRRTPLTAFWPIYFTQVTRLEDNSESRVLSLMTKAGLVRAQKVCRRAMLFGHIAYYRATA
jgi:hypothetical protein